MRAQAGDPVSAFGGIVAFNRPVGVEVAKAMVPNFWEVILAPSFTAEALEVFATKKLLRILQTQDRWPQTARGLDARSIGGGYLVQGVDDAFAPFESWEMKSSGTGAKPRAEDLMLAQRVAKAVKSNAIVLVKDGSTVGNFTRVETFGSPFMGWVKVDVTPGSKPLFRPSGRPYAPKSGD